MPLPQGEVSFVHKYQAKSEQQQRNFGSFAEVWPKIRDGGHGDGFN
jgi:hypothetical protein